MNCKKWDFNTEFINYKQFKTDTKEYKEKHELHYKSLSFSFRVFCLYKDDIKQLG